MQTDDLIESLAAGLQPVRPLHPPLRRGLAWLGCIGALGLLAVLRYANLTMFLQRWEVTRIAFECIGSALTAMTAILAAFQLSVPDRSQRWAWLPLPPLLLWLGASGLGCLQNGWGLRSAHSSESPGCFTFIAALSVPLGITLFGMLRRARPIAPLPVAALGALGIAATSATVLQFFHPFDITVLDLAFHLAAVALVIFASALLRRTLLSAP
jgi:hypothetical protein